MSEEKIKKLEEELELTKAQVKEYLDGWKRAKADYLNREREIEKEKIEWIKFANLEIILNLLPILDSFEQSVKQIPDEMRDNEWAKGVLKIKEQFENFLKAQGVEKIKTIGEKFNPEIHEAVEKKSLSADLPASPAGGSAETPLGADAEALAKGEGTNEIVEEVQSGYTMHGQVIRAAKVVIK